MDDIFELIAKMEEEIKMINAGNEGKGSEFHMGYCEGLTQALRILKRYKTSRGRA